MLGLLGASGSGKSMTLAAIAGLETPEDGRIELNGRVLFDAKAGIRVPPAARGVGVVFQDDALFPHLTVRENIAFGLHRLSVPHSDPSRDRQGAVPPERRRAVRADRQRAVRAERQRRISEWARLARVDGLLDRYPDQLSGGQRQRVALARALAMEPEALLLDEPFTGLDPHLRRQLEEELRAVLAAYRGAVILVTHDRNEAFRMCEEIVVLSEGRVAGGGPRAALFANPETLAAARVTGCKNIARMRPDGPGRVAVREWGCTLAVPGPVPPGASHIGIRAHYVCLSAEPGGVNAFPCRVLDVVESPFEVTVYLDLNGGRIEAEMPIAEWQLMAAAPQLWLRLDPEKLLLLRDTMQHE